MTTWLDYGFAAVPLGIPLWMLGHECFRSNHDAATKTQLLAYVTLAVSAFLMTNSLVPHIQQYTLRKGICGKDLGKRGTDRAEIPIPEALGIAPGTVFLVCLILCLVGYATQHPVKMLDVNSALLSICFMLFLGFTDDVLDWPWRYKLVLPTVASLPLLCCYNGSTSIVVPIPLRWMLVQDSQLTILGEVASQVIGIDVATNGTTVDLGILYLVYMGLLAVFCTNAINIYAGINGLEAGQSYIIGCAILVHNLTEIASRSSTQENHLFSSMIVLIFVGATLGLLRHNWYPATVFVGDTYCYFAGMTFAVVGILGHFSKTLLLFFIPQVLNFVWSVPQLFKIVPCPRHRLPAFNSKTKLMEPSTFDCASDQYGWLKRLYRLPLDATTIPNMTIINLTLCLLGPMSERTLCVTLLAFQILCCSFGFVMRYYVAQFFF
ncbi:glycosyl transferase family protein [Nitzschia inconspicua]|uniref:UDP-N-acetylglucosamine--dolichyl-phosphate N-acetylglucosaminephosphotransferase n=1 Tax=Nitzschia inconspicua TaxID=303405 RepID=A0A9K3KX73_9STRA|nr:glycosyl transferase family protein [Nitzschia inconspicua]